MADVVADTTQMARRYRFTFLTAALLVLIAVAPLFGADPAAEADVAVIFSLIVFGVAAAARRTTLALLACLIWVAFTWVRPLGPGAAGDIAADAALIVLVLISVESALQRALRATRVDREAIAAALAAYLLLGVGWAAAYTLLETAAPGTFAMAPDIADQPWSALLYFSFATLTTLGYGDILPLSPIARGLASVEAVAGTFFTAVLVARLVGAYGSDADVRA